MEAVLAIHASSLESSCRAFLQALKIRIIEVRDALELSSILARSTPTFILTERYIDAAPVVDIAIQYKDKGIPWILIQNLIDGLGVEYALAQSSAFFEILDENPPWADVVSAIRRAMTPPARPPHASLSTAPSPAFLWRCTQASPPEPERRGENEISGFPLLSGEHPTLGSPALQRQYPAETAALNARFSHARHGHLAFVAPCAILMRIVSETKSGALHLWRDRTHTCMTFFAGLPTGITTNEPCLDVFWHAFQTGALTGQAYHDLRRALDAETMTRRDAIDAIPHAVCAEQAWIRQSLLDLTALQHESFDWIEDEKKRPAPIPMLGYDDMMHLLEKAIMTRIPLSTILKGTRECLPFFLKIRDNTGLANRLFSSPHAKAVVERLEKGDTLLEMLAFFSQEYPVHRTLYALLSLGSLDLE